MLVLERNRSLEIIFTLLSEPIMNTKQFSGVFTALATPMKGGEVAYADLEKLVAHQLDGGINGLVSVGTTGESPTLTKPNTLKASRHRQSGWRQSAGLCWHWLQLDLRSGRTDSRSRKQEPTDRRSALLQ